MEKNLRGKEGFLMEELSKAEIEEIYHENTLWKKRSQEYRQRCIHLESKCSHLENKLKNQLALRSKQESNHRDVIQDMEFQLKNAIDVINTLKELLEKSQKDRMQLLEQHNDRMTEVQILKEKLFRTGMFYDQCLAELSKVADENMRLRLVNTKLVETLRERDKD